jgi:L-fuconolactonase
MSTPPVRATAPLVIDAHQHFWDPQTHLLSGLVGKYQSLRRPFRPEDLEPLLETAAVSRTVVVQADATMADTFGMLEVGRRHPFVAGVVGWLDPEQHDPASAVRAHLEAPGGAKLVGYRLPARDHPNPDWLREAGPWRAATSIGDAGLVTEFTMRPENLGAALTLLEALGTRSCVVDHMMTIPVGDASRRMWKQAIVELAALPNVYLKISGMIDDPAPDGWRPAWFQSAVDDVLEAWDSDRLMFGTDWPVCTLARSYTDVVAWTRSAIASLDAEQQAAVLGGNAARCYGLKRHSETTP